MDAFLTQSTEPSIHEAPKLYDETALAKLWNAKFNGFENPFPNVQTGLILMPGPSMGNAGRWAQMAMTQPKDPNGTSEFFLKIANHYYDKFKDSKSIKRHVSGKGYTRELMNGQINLTIEEAKVFAAVLLKFLRESGGISVDEVSKMDLTPLTA